METPRRGRVIVLETGEAPGEVREALRAAGVAEHVPCRTNRALRAALGQEVALLVIVAACTPALMNTVRAAVQAQPPWADLPILVLASPGEIERCEERIERLGPRRHVLLLERPVPRPTLVTAVQALLRGQHHQHDVRALVGRMERFAHVLEVRVQRRTEALRTANACLEAEVERREQLQQINLEISTQERQRFAQDLHDGLCQQLSSLSFLTSILEAKLGEAEGEVRERVQKIATLADAAIRETRALSHSMFSPALEEQRLDEALRELAATMSEAHGIRCEVRAEAEALPRSPVVAHNLYRIAQEALSNAIRHGRAQTVRITLGASAGAACLHVQDDGVGMSERPTGGTTDGDHEGIGMRTMRRRAATIDGALEVETVPGRGTTVTCRLPLRPAPTAPPAEARAEPHVKSHVPRGRGGVSAP